MGDAHPITGDWVIIPIACIISGAELWPIKAGIFDFNTIPTLASNSNSRILERDFREKKEKKRGKVGGKMGVEDMKESDGLLAEGKESIAHACSH